MNIFDLVFTQPILNLLLAFHFLFNLTHLPFSLGFAIIFLTIFVRLLLAPLTATQLKSAVKTAQLRPELAKLQKKFGQDKKGLAVAQMELYRSHGVNPAAGCLPLILQIPIFIALYNVLLKVLAAADAGSGVDTVVNQLVYSPFLAVGGGLDLNFFGFNLASRPADFAKAGFQLLAIPPATAALQYWQSKTMFPTPPKTEKAANAKDPKPTIEETLTQMQSQMIWLMPAMIGFFSFGFPVGLSLYWNIFTLFGIAQQYWITKGFKLSKILQVSHEQKN